MYDLDQSKIKDKMIRTLSVILWMMLVPIVVHLGLAGYFYYYYKIPSVTWSNIPFPTVSKIIKQDEPIILHIERCSKLAVHAHITRQIVDTLVYSLPPTEVIFNKECVVEDRLIPDVSEKLPLGVYHNENHIEVLVHWLYFTRTDSYDTSSQDFTIVK